MTDPKDINYPSTPEERETFMRLQLAKGSHLLADADVRRIEAARRRRELRAAR